MAYRFIVAAEAEIPRFSRLEIGAARTVESSSDELWWISRWGGRESISGPQGKDRSHDWCFFGTWRGACSKLRGHKIERQLEQIDVNVRSLVAPTHAFTPGMGAAWRGGVINIASSAAFQPLAGAQVYAASKAFVLFFSERLSLELAQSNVHVPAACPGPVATQLGARLLLRNATLRIAAGTVRQLNRKAAA